MFLLSWILYFYSHKDSGTGGNNPSLLENNLHIDSLFNASAWVLQDVANLWVTGDLDGRQRLQKVMFPDGLRYSI